MEDLGVGAEVGVPVMREIEKAEEIGVETEGIKVEAEVGVDTEEADHTVEREVEAAAGTEETEVVIELTKVGGVEVEAEIEIGGEGREVEVATMKDLRKKGPVQKTRKILKTIILIPEILLVIDL